MSKHQPNHTIMTRWRALKEARECLPKDTPQRDVHRLAIKLLRENWKDLTVRGTT